LSLPPWAWSPDSKQIATINKTGVAVYDVSPALARFSVFGHTRDVTALAWLPEGRLVSGSEDGSMLLWNMADFEQRLIAGIDSPQLQDGNVLRRQPDGIENPAPWNKTLWIGAII